MKYSIPLIPHDLLYKEHAEFFGSRIEPIPLCEQFKSVMEKRNVSRTDLQEMTGLSPQRIGTILSMKDGEDPGHRVRRDHIYAVMIALRMDTCDYLDVMSYFHYAFGGCFYKVHERDWYARYFVEHSSTVEECTVANCNKALIEAGFEPLTDLLPDSEENT